MNLKDKVILITGGSRGIGLEIALRAAKDGARIAIAAKTTAEDSKHSGTIYSAADAIRAAGGQAIAIQCDVRDEAMVKNAIDETVKAFGGIDIIVNNAGAIQLTSVEQTEMKRFDLMQQINTRAVYLTAKHALPYLKKSTNAHILSLSPPLNLEPAWLGPQLAYTLSKYGMSLCTIGLAAEFKAHGIAVNSLWPETAIDTAAIRKLLGDEASKVSRKATIVADAAYWIFTQPAKTCSGNFFIDSKVLEGAGVTDLSQYAVDPKAELLPDFFLGKPTPEMMAKIKAAHAAAPAPATSGSPGPAAAAGSEKGSTAAPASAFTISHNGGVATLSLNNPTRSNALGQSFWAQFAGTLKGLAQDGKTRALVITGEGANFCSGIDVSLFANPALADTKSDAGKAAVSKLIEGMQATFNAIEQVPFPVIAAVHGACLGAGLDLIAACDFRFAASGATFAVAEINLGIIADLGSLQRLPQIMPEGLVREMAYSGAPISAERAQSAGLVNAVFVDKQAMVAHVVALAAAIAEKHPAAVQASKKALVFNQSQNLAAGLKLAADLQIEVIDPAVIKANAAKIMAKKS